MDKEILILHGPNLNLLGSREPSIYGSKKLTDINSKLVSIAKENNIGLDIFQSNSESELIETLHRAGVEGVRYLIINPAAFTHTSVALRDAISAVKIPFVEVHLSNIHAREPFRKKSFFSDLADGVICGLGDFGYSMALFYIIDKLKSRN